MGVYIVAYLPTFQNLNVGKRMNDVLETFHSMFSPPDIFEILDWVIWMPFYTFLGNISGIFRPP